MSRTRTRNRKRQFTAIVSLPSVIRNACAVLTLPSKCLCKPQAISHSQLMLVELEPFAPGLPYLCGALMMISVGQTINFFSERQLGDYQAKGLKA